MRFEIKIRIEMKTTNLFVIRAWSTQGYQQLEKADQIFMTQELTQITAELFLQTKYRLFDETTQTYYYFTKSQDLIDFVSWTGSSWIHLKGEHLKWIAIDSAIPLLKDH